MCFFIIVRRIATSTAIKKNFLPPLVVPTETNNLMEVIAANEPAENDQNVQEAMPISPPTQINMHVVAESSAQAQVIPPIEENLMSTRAALQPNDLFGTDSTGAPVEIERSTQETVAVLPSTHCQSNDVIQAGSTNNLEQPIVLPQIDENLAFASVQPNDFMPTDQQFQTGMDTTFFDLSLAAGTSQNWFDANKNNSFNFDMMSELNVQPSTSDFKPVVADYRNFGNEIIVISDEEDGMVPKIKQETGTDTASEQQIANLLRDNENLRLHCEALQVRLRNQSEISFPNHYPVANSTARDDDQGYDADEEKDEKKDDLN